MAETKARRMVNDDSWAVSDARGWFTRGERGRFTGWLATRDGYVAVDAKAGAEGWLSLRTIIDGREYRHYRQPMPDALSERGLAQRASRWATKVRWGATR